MNEPWEENLKPDSVKKMDEIKKEKEGHSIYISKSFKCNWDDKLWSVGNKLFGWIWRR